MNTIRQWAQGWMLVLGLVLLGSAQAAGAPVNTGLFGSTAIKGYDPVAYHLDKKPVKGSDKFVHEWNGAKWQFASAEHLALFKAEPERYAPVYGGYCAFGVAKNDLVGIDPEAWTVLGDKLYLNYSKDIQKQWEQDVPGFLKKADANWPGLVKK